MPTQPATPSPSLSTANLLRSVLSPSELESIARETQFMRRKRAVEPFALLVACLSTLGAGHTTSIADIHRAFNAIAKTPVEYKPFHQQLAKGSFPVFVSAVLHRLVAGFGRVLAPQPLNTLGKFDDILMHDGCSMAVHDSLADTFPGRFTANSPAAVELHVTMSCYKDQPIRVELAADSESEQNYCVEPELASGCLVLKDRGYQCRRYFSALVAAGGHYIVRGILSIRPVVERAVRASGLEDRVMRGMKLEPGILPCEDIDLDICWGSKSQPYRGRLVILYTPGARQDHIYLHTNLNRSEYSAQRIGELYRLRWQIELLFKGWKSHANLRKFATGKASIAEGLIWTSILAASLKRVVAHAAEATHEVPISTQRVAKCAGEFLRPLLSSIAHGARAIAKQLDAVLEYLALNARRARPDRDKASGRLRSGLAHVFGHV